VTPAATDWNAAEAIAGSIAAFITTAALVITLITVRVEARRRREDVARIDAQLRDAEAAQAGLVIAGDATTVVGSATATLVVSNFSQRPVFDVHVRLLLDGEPVGLTDGRDDRAVVEPVLEPGEQRAVTLNAPYGDEPLVAARLEMRDSMGLRWLRDNNGRPERLV
jgi:hypothetical protein